jgi:hypothetical protein
VNTVPVLASSASERLRTAAAAAAAPFSWSAIVSGFVQPQYRRVTGVILFSLAYYDQA